MNQRNKILAVIAILAVVGASLALVNFLAPSPGSPRSARIDESYLGVFRFAAAGDFGGPGSEDMLGLSKRVAGSGASFLLALGDLGYTSDEQGWCGAIKAQFNAVVVIAGSHDTTESGPGDITQDVIYCPFTLGVPVTGGPGTPGDGYGYEYYFDYPHANPLARFILIVAGVQGNLSYDYGAGSAHYNWVVDSVTGARSRGIPWVIVGMHKMCVTAGGKASCEMGQAMFDKLVDLKVDLILQAHDHVYERSKQLALSMTCPTVPSGGRFDSDCIVDDGSDASYAKDAGSVNVIQGTGGASPYNVNLGGGDAEIGYFAEVMGANANTEGRSRGYGFVRYAVGADRIVGVTDLCPPGQTESNGACPGQIANTFHDAFEIVVADTQTASQAFASSLTGAVPSSRSRCRLDNSHS